MSVLASVMDAVIRLSFINALIFYPLWIWVLAVWMLFGIIILVAIILIIIKK